jgi:hypothetical protein
VSLPPINTLIEHLQQLTIDCDKETISMENQTRKIKDSMNVDLTKSPLAWKFILSFFLRIPIVFVTLKGFLFSERFS